MDPTSLAASAVSLLVPYLARIGGQVVEHVGSDLSQIAIERLEQLYQRIKRKVAGDRFAEPALERLEQRPGSEVQQASLGEILGEMVSTDPIFATELAALVHQAQRTPGLAITQISDAGAVAAGGNIHMQGINVAGRDITLDDRQAPGGTG
jgi:hypothetical protein